MSRNTRRDGRITPQVAWQALLETPADVLREGQLRIPGQGVLGLFDEAGRLLPGAAGLSAPARRLLRLYVPLKVRPMLRIAQIGQSLDGRIAVGDGQSQFVTGREDIRHLHRLRALVDAVLVGPGTVRADDPLLTVRHVPGPNPVRVVLDPRNSLPADRRVFHDRASRTVLLRGGPARDDIPEHVQQLRVETGDSGLQPPAVVEALERLGLVRLLVEGGGRTVSQFLGAGQLTDLSVTVAPLLLGSGAPAFTLPAITHVDQALRPACRQFSLGEDRLYLFDLLQSTMAPGTLPQSTTTP